MKYENYSIRDFINESNNTYISEIEMYLYLKQITNNFDRDIFEKFNKDFNFICGSIIQFTVPIKEINVFTGEEETIYSYRNDMTFNEFYLKYIFNELNNQVDNIQFDKDVIDDSKEKYKHFQRIKNLKLFNMFIYELPIDGKIDIIEKTPDFEFNFNFLRDKNNGIIRLSKFVETEYQKIMKTKPEIQNDSTRKSKEPLTFSGLFKDDYIPRKPLFYSRLETNGLIDTNHIWRETENKNEPAKVYFWLLDKGVLKHNTPTPALICFCKEFGITAYNDNESTPPAEIRAVTVKNLLKAKDTISTAERKRFENIFSPFLI